MIYLTNRILKTINEKHPQFSTKTDFLFHRDIVEFYISKKCGMLLLLKTKFFSKEVNKKLNTLENTLQKLFEGIHCEKKRRIRFERKVLILIKFFAIFVKNCPNDVIQKYRKYSKYSIYYNFQ